MTQTVVPVFFLEFRQLFLAKGLCGVADLRSVDYSEQAFVVFSRRVGGHFRARLLAGIRAVEDGFEATADEKESQAGLRRGKICGGEIGAAGGHGLAVSDSVDLDFKLLDRELKAGFYAANSHAERFPEAKQIRAFARLKKVMWEVASEKWPVRSEK